MAELVPILFVHSSDELYGSDVVLLQLVSGLDRERFQPIVVTPADIVYEGRLGRALAAQGIIHYSLKLGVLRRRYFTPVGLVLYGLYLIEGLRLLRYLVRKYQVRLVFSNTSAVFGGALAARAEGLPHVWHVHEIIERPAWLGRLIYSYIRGHAQRIVAISGAVAAAVDPEHRCKSIRVIYNGVDTERFRPDVDGVEARAAWGLPPDRVVFGVVGRISRWKGQGLFVEAAARMAAPNRAAFVVVGGPVPGEEGQIAELQGRARELGLAESFLLRPFSTAVPELMRGLDVLVLPSTSPEPFGLVVLEAMASGRPVIASAHGGPLEMVVHGETGLLVPPGDPLALAAAMSQLAADPELRVTMGARARERALKLFALDRFRRQFHDLFIELICEHSGGA